MPRFRIFDKWSADYQYDVDAYIDALRQLRMTDTDLFRKLSARHGTRFRRYFASTAHGLFPRTPRLASDPSNYRSLPPDWYADTNLSNPQKVQMLRRACGLAGLDHADFEIQFRDDHYSPLSPAEEAVLGEKLIRELEALPSRPPQCDGASAHLDAKNLGDSV